MATMVARKMSHTLGTYVLGSRYIYGTSYFKKSWCILRYKSSHKTYII
jgi:hypothetical protein